MANLPQFQGYDDETVQLLQNKWAAIINPVVNNPSNNARIIKDYSLSIGSNTINHKLGKKLQVWRLVRKRAAAEIYDDQDNNPSPQLTLVLVSDSNVVVDLEVF